MAGRGRGKTLPAWMTSTAEGFTLASGPTGVDNAFSAPINSSPRFEPLICDGFNRPPAPNSKPPIDSVNHLVMTSEPNFPKMNQSSNMHFQPKDQQFINQQPGRNAEVSSQIPRGFIPGVIPNLSNSSQSMNIPSGTHRVPSTAHNIGFNSQQYPNGVGFNQPFQISSQRNFHNQQGLVLPPSVPYAGLPSAVAPQNNPGLQQNFPFRTVNVPPNSALSLNSSLTNPVVPRNQGNSNPVIGDPNNDVAR